jgi:hypothetical protein
MSEWKVSYVAEMWVEADSEDEAIEKAVDEWAGMPDGNWEAERYS